MAIKLIGILAAFGLLTAGTAVSAENRSAAAIPAASMAAVAQSRIVSSAKPVRQVGRPDCLLKANKRLPACAAPGGAAGGGGTGAGAIIGVGAAALGIGGLFIAIQNKSNG